MTFGQVPPARWSSGNGGTLQIGTPASRSSHSSSCRTTCTVWSLPAGCRVHPRLVGWSVRSNRSPHVHTVPVPTAVVGRRCRWVCGNAGTSTTSFATRRTKPESWSTSMPTRSIGRPIPTTHSVQRERGRKVGSGRGRRSEGRHHLVRSKRSRGGFEMGDRKGRPYRASSPSCSRRGDACLPDAGFPTASFGSVRDATRAWDAHLVRSKGSRAGFGMGDREGRPYAGLVAELFGCRGDACRRPCRFPTASFGSARDATRAWHATSYEGYEAVLDSGWATARVAPTRASSPSCSGRRGDACRRPCRIPDGLVWVGTGRRKGVARHLVRRIRSRAGFGMGDRKGRPYAGLVAELFGA